MNLRSRFSQALALTIVIKTLFHLSNMKQFFFVASTLLFIAAMSQTACYYDNEKTLYGDNVCDTTLVSYLSDIKPIVEANCISCHAPGGEQEISPLLTYEDMIKYISDNNMVDRVRGNSSLMPPSGKMGNCNLLLIEAWINQGALNN